MHMHGRNFAVEIVIFVCKMNHGKMKKFLTALSLITVLPVSQYVYARYAAPATLKNDIRYYIPIKKSCRVKK